MSLYARCSVVSKQSNVGKVTREFVRLNQQTRYIWTTSSALRPQTRREGRADLPLRFKSVALKGDIMAPTTALGKQYMSSGSKPAKQVAEPRPSSSILLISPTNEILLLHRVRTSSSFPSAHVFPGGNLAAQDGEIPAPGSEGRHKDSKAYRVGALRECFEESGLLLARRKDGVEGLLEVQELEREKGRKDIHEGKVKFTDWVEQRGGIIDTENLIPFTRWVTPTNLPKRFTTQMYLYFLPISSPSTVTSTKNEVPTPTSDGGLEHTAAEFALCTHWLSRAKSNEIILFPPQFYLMHLLSPFLTGNTTSATELQAQRDKVFEFLKGDGGDGKGISWADKCMSPIGIQMRNSDGRSVLGLEKPGPELKGSGRGGDEKRVVLVKFGKGGPRYVEVRERAEVLQEERADSKL